MTHDLVHWAYGLAWGVVFGIATVTSRPRCILSGLLFGSVVWLFANVILPPGKLYKPIWEHDAATLAKDLTAHLLTGRRRLARRHANRRLYRASSRSVNSHDPMGGSICPT